MYRRTCFVFCEASASTVKPLKPPLRPNFSLLCSCRNCFLASRNSVARENASTPASTSNSPFTCSAHTLHPNTKHFAHTLFIMPVITLLDPEPLLTYALVAMLSVHSSTRFPPSSSSASLPSIISSNAASSLCAWSSHTSPDHCADTMYDWSPHLTSLCSPSSLYPNPPFDASIISRSPNCLAGRLIGDPLTLKIRTHLRASPNSSIISSVISPSSSQSPSGRMHRYVSLVNIRAHDTAQDIDSIFPVTLAIFLYATLVGPTKKDLISSSSFSIFSPGI